MIGFLFYFIRDFFLVSYFSLKVIFGFDWQESWFNYDEQAINNFSIIFIG